MKISRQRLTIISGIVALVLVLALVGVGLVYAVYVGRSDNSVVRKVAASWPAARLGAYTITYGQFTQSRDTLHTYLASDAAKAQGATGPYTPELEKQATIERLLRDDAIEEIAAQRGITITDPEVRAQFATMTASSTNSASSTVNLAQYLADNFGWNEEQFRQNIVRPMMLESRVALTFSTSTQEALTSLQQYIDTRLAKPDVKVYLHF